MKAFGSGFKTLHDVGMGLSSGMRVGLGLHLSEKPSEEDFQVELVIPPQSRVPCEFQIEGLRNFKKSYISFAYSDLAAIRMGMSGSAFFQSVKKSL